MAAGGPHELIVAGKNELTVEDVLVGEVWICSGQSNMAWSLGASTDGAAAVEAANFPAIRLLQVPRRPAGQPASDVQVAWQECSPANARRFSAVAYFFGREVHRALKVPVGLINTSWGGTRIEPWTTAAGFAVSPELAEIGAQAAQRDSLWQTAAKQSLGELEAWLPRAKQALADGLPPMPMPFPAHPLASHGQPTGLYNGMVHPFVPYAIRGAIWYQGEANRTDGMLYAEKMKALITGWRQAWGQGDFPFYFVQLAPFRYGGDAEALARLWEAQTATLQLPHTGMAVVNDIATVGNIHPPNKEDVGKRLALWALARTYGKKGLVHSGPLYKSMEVTLDEIQITFDHVGSGLTTRNGQPPSHFEIAGEDGRYLAAEATIDGAKITVRNPEITEPVAVRFAWRQDAEPNLMNKEGLPASAFRTHRLEATAPQPPALPTFP